MRRTLHIALLLLISLIGTTGCLSEADTVLSIDASGAVAGLLFIDRNGDAEFTPATDVAAGGISFAVVRGSRDTVATGTTDPSGVSILTMIPVGSYRLVLDEAQLGDSLQVVNSGEAAVVQANDTTPVFVAIQHPPLLVREARLAPSGRLLMVEGVALNAWGTFGDSTVHVADSTGALRAVRVMGSPVASGDSVRVLGRSAQLQGDRALTDATMFVVGSAAEPDPTPVTTADAATARTGSLAAALVRVSKARILDGRQLASGDIRLQVDDGSGVLEVLLDRDAGITSEEPILVGAEIEATGVLVPLASGRWQLKPRGTSDFEARVPTATIAAARALPPGQAVAIEGVALNGWATFGDGSVHMADSTGSVRVFERLTSIIAAGDSLRFVGTIQIANGQPILSSVGVTHRGRAHWFPSAISVSSGVAATADEGALDAALVTVAGAVVDSVKTVASETHLVVDDGTGQVTVVLDRDAGISSGGYAEGDVINVVGLMVPTGSGTWVLKPRSGADLSEH